VALFNRGCALCDLRRADEAITNFERAVSLDSSYTEALERMGFSFVLSPARWNEGFDWNKGWESDKKKN
jgi:hypothetical protein